MEIVVQSRSAFGGVVDGDLFGVDQDLGVEQLRYEASLDGYEAEAFMKLVVGLGFDGQGLNGHVGELRFDEGPERGGRECDRDAAHEEGSGRRFFGGIWFS